MKELRAFSASWIVVAVASICVLELHSEELQQSYWKCFCKNLTYQRWTGWRFKASRQQPAREISSLVQDWREDLVRGDWCACLSMVEKEVQGTIVATYRKRLLNQHRNSSLSSWKKPASYSLMQNWRFLKYRLIQNLLTFSLLLVLLLPYQYSYRSLKGWNSFSEIWGSGTSIFDQYFLSYTSYHDSLSKGPERSINCISSVKVRLPFERN